MRSNEVLDQSRTALSVMGLLPPGMAQALIEEQGQLLARNAKLKAALREARFYCAEQYASDGFLRRLDAALEEST
jgi:hypothetical protein